MSPFFTSGGQSVGVSASASVLPMNIQDLSSFRLTGLISVQPRRPSSIFSSITVWKHQFFGTRPSVWFSSHSIHDYWKNHSFDLTDLCQQSHVMSLFFSMLSRFVIVFLPRSKCLLISWLQSLSVMILEPKKIKSVTVSIFFPIYLPWSDWTRCHDLSFLNVEF